MGDPYAHFMAKLKNKNVVELTQDGPSATFTPRRDIMYL
jgi:hypothetical protein